MQESHARSATAADAPTTDALPVPSWLTYDSRSGSTTLSRRLDALHPALWVTPEIGFDSVVAWRGPCGADALPAIAQASVAAGDWLNLGLAADALADAVRAAQRAAAGAPDARAVLVRTLLARAAAARGRTGATHVLVKNGTHLRAVDAFRAVFGDATRMVFLARDPRAVAESKLRTRRPYHPWETFAWGGAIHAAVRWNDYALRATDAAARWPGMLVVRFEDFAAAPADVEAGILAHLGLAPAGGTPGTAARAGSYAIPAREAAIHGRAASGALDAASLDEWRTRLGARKRLVIERLCREGMRRLGYGAPPAGHARLALPFALEGARTAWGIARHAALARWHRWRGTSAAGRGGDGG